MIDWNIHSRAHGCQVCQKPFSDQQPFHTILCDQRHEYQRLDVCETCWQAETQLELQQRKGFISQWKGVYQAPPASPPEAIQKDTAETLLPKLVQKNDPRFRAASYILAVMLERKRILKVRGQTTENGHRVFIYEHSKTGDVFTIADPDLQLNQLEEVQREVAYLLAHGCNGNGNGTATTTAAAATPAASDAPADAAPTAPTADAPDAPAPEFAAPTVVAADSASAPVVATAAN